MQEGDRQPQAGKTVFVPVAAVFLDDAIKLRRDLGLILKPQPTVERHRLSAQHILGELSLPSAQIVRTHTFYPHHDGDACLGVVNRTLCRAKVDQPVASRQVEQPVAKMREHSGPATGNPLRLGQDALYFDACRLIAPGIQPSRQFSHVGGAFVAVELGRFENYRSDDRMQARRDGEQVLAIEREAFDIIEFRWIETACQRSHNHAQQEHIGDLVVMTQLGFPIPQPGNVDRVFDFDLITVEDRQIVDFCPALFILRDAVIANHLERTGNLRLNLMDGLEVGARWNPGRICECKLAVIIFHHRVERDLRNPATRVQVGNLPHEPQHGVYEVVR